MSTLLLRDVRFTFRLLQRAPGFFAALLLTLVVGIGATTAVFSIVESLLLKPLPFREPSQLTVLRVRYAGWAEGPVSLADYLDWKAQATSFEQMAAVAYDSFGLTSEGAKPERLEGANVSGDFFSLFGARALKGRLLGPEDDRPGGARVAVLSASVWQRRFAADPAIVGRGITLNGRAYSVVGIAPEGFRFSRLNVEHTDVWTPLAVTQPGYIELTTSERNYHFLHVIARMKPGVGLEQAQTKLSSVASNLELAHPETNQRKGARVVDLHEYLVGSSRARVWTLFSCAGLAFLIVCANVASLLLTRAQARRSEMALRGALGATPLRLVAQVVTETAVIFGVGAVGGAVVAALLVNAFVTNLLDAGARAAIDVGMDGWALLACIVLSLGCGLLFGLVPAIAASRIEPASVLKESSVQSGVSPSQRSARSALVVVEVTLAVMLLVASGLTAKTLAERAATPPGFNSANLATARVALPPARYPTHPQVAQFHRELLQRLDAEQGVAAVALSSSIPMAGGLPPPYEIRIEGRAAFDMPTGLGFHTVSPSYFSTMGIPLLRGRVFNELDQLHSRPVMLISQSAATQFFPGEDPIGRRIDWGFNEGEWRHVFREIVGVVADVRSRGLGAPGGSDGYVPLAQNPDNLPMTVVVRSAGPGSLLPKIPSVLQGIDASQDVANLAMMDDLIADSLKSERQLVILLGAFGVAALALAVFGVFGVVAHAAAQRTRELGIRMALGSTPEGVLWLVIKPGVLLLAGGVCLGLAGALLGGRALADQVPELATLDWMVYLATPLVLAFSGVIGCTVPAWRAATMPPAEALRRA